MILLGEKLRAETKRLRTIRFCWNFSASLVALMLVLGTATGSSVDAPPAAPAPEVAPSPVSEPTTAAIPNPSPPIEAPSPASAPSPITTRGLAAPKERVLFESSPSFHPAADKWGRFDSTETLGQPVTFWEFKEKPELRIIHYTTWQAKEAGDSWDELLKKTCSLLPPQLSAALGTNIAAPKVLKIGSVPGCMLRIQADDKSVTEHYVFIWSTRKERSNGVFQGHTLTVNYPQNYLAQGHEAVEKFLSSIKLPGAVK